MEKEMSKLDEMTIYVDVANNKESIEKLEQVLLQLDGLERALVDTDDGEVKITYNQTRLSNKMILHSIKQNGFDILP